MTKRLNRATYIKAYFPMQITEDFSVISFAVSTVLYLLIIRFPADFRNVRMCFQTHHSKLTEQISMYVLVKPNLTQLFLYFRRENNSSAYRYLFHWIWNFIRCWFQNSSPENRGRHFKYGYVLFYYLSLFLVGWGWVHLVLRPLLTYYTSPRW
jgi:hypothetical protein